MERPSFGERLRVATRRHGRLCVGIDPHPALLDAWGLPQTADGVERFGMACVEACAGRVAIAKPQVAFFERYGAAGIAALERVQQALRDAGILVLSDAKRGDIGTTMAAYASAWLDDASPLRCDALTVSPYLGVGALQPAIDLAAATGRALFVLARTSNPEGVAVQEARPVTASAEVGSEMQTQGWGTVAQAIVDEAAAVNAPFAARGDLGPVGLVVGATVGTPPRLDDLNGPVLLPGVGAQGASLADADRVAGPARSVALPTVSRGVLAAGPSVAEIRRAIASFAISGGEDTAPA